ncbi:hypothetical protein OS42_43270 [Dickeya oryzae]
MNALGLQDLREVITEDIFLSELEASGGIVLHTDMGYPVVEYKGTDIRIAIEPINLASMRDLTNGYVASSGIRLRAISMKRYLRLLIGLRSLL